MKCKTIRKTVTGLVLCLALLSGASGTALAQSVPSIITPSTSSANTQVKAGATEGYMLIIPPEINLGELAVEGGSKPMASASFKLTAKEVLIADGASLEVTAAGSGAQDAFILSITGQSPDTSVPYKLVNQSSEVKPGERFCTFESGMPGTDQSFSAQAVQTVPARYAGDYTGTLSFTCTIVNP